MEYNTQRPRLKINDYGRNIYKLIEYAKTVEDRDKRNRMAEAIVDIMSHNSTEPKDSEDYKRKFWVHLMILSNWELDVDMPYDISREESVEFTPRPLGYNQGKTRYRHKTGGGISRRGRARRVGRPLGSCYETRLSALEPRLGGRPAYKPSARRYFGRQAASA